MKYDGCKTSLHKYSVNLHPKAESEPKVEQPTMPTTIKDKDTSYGLVFILKAKLLNIRGKRVE